jgi:hypothetical protein
MAPMPQIGSPGKQSARNATSNVTRCTRCIMPSTVPGVTFDKDGVCSVCSGFAPHTLLGESAFVELLEHRETGRGNYDCVVPLSGGRDSTYVLYLAKTVYGLKPLAVNYDNEFRSPQAVKNIESACRALDVDLSVVRSKQSINSKIVRANVKAAVPLGLGFVVESFCRNCEFGFRGAVYQEAAAHGVPLILWGDSAAESTAKVGERAVRGIRPSKWNKVRDVNFYKTEYYCIRQHLECPIKGQSAFSRQKPALHDSATREISVFDYIPWEREKIKGTITTQLGWSKPPDSVSTWRTDCMMHEFVNYFFMKSVGCTRDCIGYCNMIAAGQMTRQEALEQEERALTVPWQHIGGLLRERIGLSEREIARVEALQVASWSDTAT